MNQPITAIAVTYAPRAENREIAALINNPQLLGTQRYRLIVSNAGNVKLSIIHHRRKCWYTRHYHVEVSNGIMLI